MIILKISSPAFSTHTTFGDARLEDTKCSMVYFSRDLHE